MNEYCMDGSTSACASQIAFRQWNMPDDACAHKAPTSRHEVNQSHLFLALTSTSWSAMARVLQQQAAGLQRDFGAVLHSLSQLTSAVHELGRRSDAISLGVQAFDLPDTQERGVQASLEAGPSAGLPTRITVGAPFRFQKSDRRVNWARLRSLDLAEIHRETDVQGLMSALEDFAYGDLERESTFNLTEASLLRLCRAQQMAIQYLLHERQQATAEALQISDGHARMEAYLDRLDAAGQAVHLDKLSQQVSAMEDALRHLSDGDMQALAGELAAVGAAGPLPSRGVVGASGAGRGDGRRGYGGAGREERVAGTRHAMEEEVEVGEFGSDAGWDGEDPHPVLQRAGASTEGSRM